MEIAVLGTTRKIRYRLHVPASGTALGNQRQPRRNWNRKSVASNGGRIAEYRVDRTLVEFAGARPRSRKSSPLAGPILFGRACLPTIAAAVETVGLFELDNSSYQYRRR